MLTALLARALAAALTFASAHAGPPLLAPRFLLWPATGTITSPYGYRGAEFHPGVDIGILRSLTVRAAAAGTVTKVGEPTGYEGYGIIVRVEVGGGYSTIYAHLSRARVRVGEQVEAGEPIAVAGCTGSCSGTHLHFEVRRGGRAVDPMRFAFRGRFSAASGRRGGLLPRSPRF